MFITNIHGQEAISAKATALDLKAGSTHFGGYTGKPAIGGNTFRVKEILKANGARWNGSCKVWEFNTVQALESALDAVAAAQ